MFRRAAFCNGLDPRTPEIAHPALVEHRAIAGAKADLRQRGHQPPADFRRSFSIELQNGVLLTWSKHRLIDKRIIDAVRERRLHRRRVTWEPATLAQQVQSRADRTATIE